MVVKSLAANLIVDCDNPLFIETPYTLVMDSIDPGEPCPTQRAILPDKSENHISSSVAKAILHAGHLFDRSSREGFAQRWQQGARLQGNKRPISLALSEEEPLVWASLGQGIALTCTICSKIC